MEWVIVALIAVALIAGGSVGAWLAWRRQVRSYILALVGRRESILAGVRGVEGILERLADASDEELVTFALQPQSAERNALIEIAQRMKVQGEELRELALPKALWRIADRLSDAADALAKQAAAIGERTGESAFDVIASLDLAPVTTLLGEASDEIAHVSEDYGLRDPAVYGGGLYI